MKVTVGGRRAAVPFEGADHIVVEGACPACGAIPFKAVGGAIVRGHDRYTAPGRCVGCGADVGDVVVIMSTIFGLEEDSRVLLGPWRVY